MAANGNTPPIRIIVPAFRDLEATQACLQSLAASDLPAGASVHVIDDCSPDPALSQFCATFCGEQDWEFTKNAQNLGFVATVNRGFQAADADVILLNSDTRVYGNWVQRMARCAYADDSTGTVTPFSNEATICSYPVFLASNDLPPGWTAAAIDDLFARANGELRHAIPTAVGFCMYIRRACLDDVGEFDEDNFGRGYGEECDFSMRAVQHGWSNMLAADVFVYHQGGASFQGESLELKTAADHTMVSLHPEWGKLVDDFLNEDPLAALRKNVDTLRLGERPNDLGEVLDEHARYARSILDRLAALAALREQGRVEIAALHEEREALRVLLEECRAQFATADDALGQADKIVEQLRREVERLGPALDAATEKIEFLEARIALMENSRSWRYTAWMRRGENRT
ncbi:MAG: glycosyltransferase [Halioglobus sp.]|nr:glycosyltransferase [Halioglobus sp.]